MTLVGELGRPIPSFLNFQDDVFMVLGYHWPTRRRVWDSLPHMLNRNNLFVDAKPRRLPTPSGENHIASPFNHLNMGVFRR